MIFFLPHISSTYFGDITPLYNPLSMVPNIKETSALRTVVEVVVEFVEAVVVKNVMETMAELVEAVVVAHTFSMEIVFLLVGFSLIQTQDRKSVVFV